MKHLFSVLFVVGLLLVSCGPKEKDMNQKPFDGVAIVAHRGFWNCEEAGYAQNSIAALRCAQEAGCWGSEFDINMTSDEVLVVFHDGWADGKKFEDNPYSAFADVRLPNGEPIPTLDQYLEQAKKCAQTKLVFELKQHSTPAVEDRAVDLSVEKLKASGLFSPDRVMFISFSLHACRRFAEVAPGFSVQYLGSNITPAEVADNGINGIDTNYGTIYGDESWVSEARERGMSVNIWTVDRDKDMTRVLGQKIDQLTTNEPLAARAMLKQMGITEVILGGK